MNDHCFRNSIRVWLSLVFLLNIGIAQSQPDRIRHEPDFSFVVAGDMRKYAGPEYQTSQYFLGACEAMKKVGKGSFMISPGDIDPPWHVRTTINKVLGKDYVWFPIIGNHEADTYQDMEWLRNWGEDIPFLVQKGPENCQTFYSFNYQHVHFVAINQYCNEESDVDTDGDITDVLYQWLRSDLEANDKPLVFVIGHEPMVVIPDIDNGRVRHLGNSLDAYPANNHRFQQLLRNHKVTAYFCGHTHNASYANINGVWQFDSGHCRGIGDKRAPSTFLKVWIKDTECLVEFYRADDQGRNYRLVQSVVIP